MCFDVNNLTDYLYICNIILRNNAYMTTTEQELQQYNVTLDDIYKAFGKQKKHYATRLKHAFLEHHIETIDDLMVFSINDLQEMHGIGSETLRLMIKKLNGLGIDYYPACKR